MKDPISPELVGTILDVARLRKLLSDPSITDDMEIYFTTNSDDEGSAIDIGSLEMQIRTNDNIVLFAYDWESIPKFGFEDDQAK